MVRLTCIVAAMLLALGLTPAAAQKRVALVIGNDTYQNVTPLRKAGNDAERIAKTLKGLGFQVISATNQNRRSMSDSLTAFERALSEGDTAFFFFAGHGFQIKGENYLLPTDVPMALDGEEEKIHENSFLARRIMERVRSKGVRTTILVLDACRNNPFERAGTRSVRGGGGLAAMSEDGAFVIYSASENQTALDYASADDKDPNSVFTRYFVKELETPGLSLVQVAKRTQASVTELARKYKHAQRPAYYDEIVGDVVLNGTLDPKRAMEVIPQQVAALPVQPSPLPNRPSEPEQLNAPLANFMRHNGGWSVTLSFADPVTAISWRYGDKGNFRETGFLDTLDPRTRKRMPNPSLQLDADTPEGTIYVRYADIRGEWAEPFPIKFDPVAALERGERQILEMTSGSWLSFREFNGLMVYYTHLMSYRCAIREVKIGIDSTVPDKKLAMPVCDPSNPSSIPHSAQPYLKLSPGTKFVSIELTYRDGSVSETKTFRADARGNR
ncbi:caspase family protein [Pseudorhodoplanes sinuspersici]|uniref:Peptidase C14, caspase catalytic subunit p20 n=1 Tax=Pseudorhodoplanes sinuspersici TaxID=1235591 RepID=A0A1W6ZX42_9HYPH|nr:caspase family protein [Pseudorhodoplanes sinuspersici]ARQ01969.1 peptidase C14, caspase catalytic subunit p20 [Pseudorhodoplanes sinuspersici]RKE73744.1 caspase domain-containing protein [Pseudorhodoplanes sinuspersici]